MGGLVSLKYYACIWFVLKDMVTLRNVGQVCRLKRLNMFFNPGTHQV